MSEAKVGTVGWIDLTVPNAEEVKTFYEQVVGWTSKKHPMGDYDDYEMQTPSGATVAGVCHQLGMNADLPAQWILYVTVADIDESVQNCLRLGGETITEIRDGGDHGRYCFVKDPAGAAIALIQPKAP